MGESLGSALAVALAAEKPVGNLVLEAPFTSVADVGARHYWFVPVRLFMKDKFRSDLLADTRLRRRCWWCMATRTLSFRLRSASGCMPRSRRPSTSCVLPAAGIAILAPVPWPRRNGSAPNLERGRVSSGSAPSAGG